MAQNQSSIFTSDILGKKQIKKPNSLIDAITSLSLLSNQLLVLSFLKAKPEDNRLVANISAKEVIILTNKSPNYNTYRNIEYASDELRSISLFDGDEKKDVFTNTAYVTRTQYTNARIECLFEPCITQDLINAKTNFTILDIPILMAFKRNESFRLYEILKSKAYQQNAVGPNQYSISYDFSHLLFLLGIVDVKAEKVARHLRHNANPDYEMIIKKYATPNSYFRWDNFRSKILIPAIDEINKISDINVDFDVLREGYGGKVTRVIFNIEKKAQDFSAAKSDITEDELSEMIDELLNYFDTPLKVKDARTLLRASGYKTQTVIKAYDLMQGREDVENPVGWLLAAIKNNFVDL